jgi:hypothetical protein
MRENPLGGKAGHAIKRYKPEQIVMMLRQIEVSIANGETTPQACKEAEITIQTFYRWRKEYGGLKMDQAKRLKDLEKENGKLKRLVAELACSDFSNPASSSPSDPTCGSTIPARLGARQLLSCSARCANWECLP